MGRREWAYLSVPVLVLLFSGGAYAWGTAGRGGETITTQLSFVRVLPDAPTGQATTYMLFFSPTRRSYDLATSADTLLKNGVPGLQERGGPALDIASGGDRVHIPNLLIDVGGVRSVIANSTVDAPQVDATIKTVDGKQQIVVHNRSDQTVEDLGLVRAGGQAQAIGSLNAGEERTLELDLRIGSPDTILRPTSNGTIKRDAVLRDLASSFIAWGPDAPANGVFVGGGFAGPGPMGFAQAMPMPQEGVPPNGSTVEQPTVEPQPGAGNVTVLNTIDDVNKAANSRLYLIGWQQRAPVNVQLDGSPSNSAGETLYFWQVSEEE
jgi:hypothetical protein